MKTVIPKITLAIMAFVPLWLIIRAAVHYDNYGYSWPLWPITLIAIIWFACSGFLFDGLAYEYCNTFRSWIVCYIMGLFAPLTIIVFLGIIGVVTLMDLPNIIKERKKIIKEE